VLVFYILSLSLDISHSFKSDFGSLGMEYIEGLDP
jgi:hypothetical protein